MNTKQYTTTDRNTQAYREYRETLAANACYEHQVTLAERQQRRLQEMQRKTAEFTGEDDGNILFL